MKWRQKDPSLRSIEDVVRANTGMTIEDLDREKVYRIERMPQAANLIHDAVRDNKRICVVTDYDADGICSAAIMKLMLESLGADFRIRIPKRISEGYGLSASIVEEFPNNALLICVDNGIAAFDAIAQAKERGMTVIILDHHMLPEDGRIPPADVVIDPAAIGEADFLYYCGAGLAYKLAVHILRKNHSCIAKCLSFAAIATVADVMPLLGENRLIVKRGLKSMMVDRGRTHGLSALMKQNGFESAITEQNLGFKIAPCLNAPGRLYDDGATDSYRLLVCENPSEASMLASNILQVNELRKQKKDEGVLILRENIKRNNLYDDVPLVLYEPGLDEGLVGLFAGHFAEELKRPCIVFTDAEDAHGSTVKVLKGSARSHGDVHLKNLLDKNAHLILKFGGHKGAAGLSINKENLEAFRSALQKSIESMDISDENYYDLEVSAKSVPTLIAKLEEFAPFGEGNPEIIFKVKDFEVSLTHKGYVTTMSNGKHGKVVNRDGVAAVAFDMGKSLSEAIDGKPKTITLYGKLAMNISQFGKFKQIQAEDFEVQETPARTTQLASKLRMAAEKY